MKIIPIELWIEIEKILPRKKSKIGRPEFCPKTTMSGIFFILKTETQWHWLLEEYAKPSTVHGKFMKWCRMGVFEKILTLARNFYRHKNSHNV